MKNGGFYEAVLIKKEDQTIRRCPMCQRILYLKKNQKNGFDPSCPECGQKIKLVEEFTMPPTVHRNLFGSVFCPLCDAFMSRVDSGKNVCERCWQEFMVSEKTHLWIETFYGGGKAMRLQQTSL